MMFGYFSWLDWAVNWMSFSVLLEYALVTIVWCLDFSTQFMPDGMDVVIGDVTDFLTSTEFAAFGRVFAYFADLVIPLQFVDMLLGWMLVSYFAALVIRFCILIWSLVPIVGGSP